MDGGIFGGGYGLGLGGREGEEGGVGWGIVEGVVCVDVCEVGGGRKVAVEETREEEGLYFRREEGGDYVKA